MRGQTDWTLMPIGDDATAAALEGGGSRKIGCGGGGQGRWRRGQHRRRWRGGVPRRWYGTRWRCRILRRRPRRRRRCRASLCRRSRSSVVARNDLLRNGVFSSPLILQIQTTFAFAITVFALLLNSFLLCLLLLLLFLLLSTFLCLFHPLRRTFADGRHRTAFHGGESRWLGSLLLLRRRRRSQKRRLWRQRRPRRGRSVGTESDGGGRRRGARGDERELRRLWRMGQRGRRHWREELLLLLLVMEQRGEGRLEASVQGETSGRGHGRVIQGRVNQRTEKRLHLFQNMKFWSEPPLNSLEALNG